MIKYNKRLIPPQENIRRLFNNLLNFMLFKGHYKTYFVSYGHTCLGISKILMKVFIIDFTFFKTSNTVKYSILYIYTSKV